MIDISQWRPCIGSWINNRCSTKCSGGSLVNDLVYTIISSGLAIFLVLFFVLLMLAGDVELNPGPDPPNATIVTKFLLHASAKWYDIGLALDVARDFREGLVAQGVMTTPVAKLESVVNKWIETKCSPVTWDHLIDALKTLWANDPTLLRIPRNIEEFIAPEKYNRTEKTIGDETDGKLKEDSTKQIKTNDVYKKKPKKEDVFDLLRKKSAQFDEFARELRVSENERIEIRMLGQEISCDRKLERVIIIWLEKEPSETTWQHLIFILCNKMEQRALAKEVDDFLKEQTAKATYLPQKDWK